MNFQDWYDLFADIFSSAADLEDIRDAYEAAVEEGSIE